MKQPRHIALKALSQYQRSCLLPYGTSDSRNLVYGFILGPFDPFGAPVWNPFLNFRGISFIVRIRPVPVVFLRLAFMPQLSMIEPGSQHKGPVG